MINGSYWISPEGEIKDVVTNHIASVIEDPETFGTSLKAITALHKKHGEKLGQEGDAREEVIINALKAGWIRVRKYPRPSWKWSITIWKMTADKKKYLKKWAVDTIKESPEDAYADVSIYDASPDKRDFETTVEDISNNILNKAYKNLLERVLDDN